VLDRDVGGLVASLKAPVAVFGNPDLRRLELAWAAMSFATWSFAIALAVYAFETAGAAAVGLVALARLLPGAVVAPFAGLLGDTRSRRGVLVTSAAATAVVLAAATVAAATDRAPAIVFCTAAGFAVVTAAYLPVESALLPQLSRTPQELSAANVALSVMENGGFLAGAIGAGVLLALGGPEVVFGLAAALAAVATALLVRLTPDQRPDYVHQPPLAQVAGQTLSGGSTILADPRLRLLATTLTILVFFEGAIDVLVVIAALELLDLGESSVGYLNAAWGIGALAAGAALAVLLHRGKLALAIGTGSLVIGAAATLMAAWPVAAAAYLALAAFGVGYTLVEVAAKTFLQRLGSDEVLARVFGFMETSRLGAMALGSVVAPLLVALLGTRGALVAAGALPVLVAALRWGSLRDFETGAPVDWRRYALLRSNEIFQPLPVATLERLCQDLQPIELADGVEVITQGGGADRFYLIEEGEVAVFRDGTLRRCERSGESFGEIALIRDVPRTATVRATCPTRLLTLEREQFVAAVTGYPRSRQLTEDLIDSQLDSREAEKTGSIKSGG
jgi:MFS family permease